MSLPRVAITPGEPAGVGPDLVVMLAQRAWPARLVAVADPDLLRARATLLGLPLETVPADLEALPEAHAPGRLPVLAVRLRRPTRPGALDPENAEYVLQTLRVAARACLRGRLGALVTGPVHKGVINEAGRPFTGHTELLAHEAGVSQVVMMLSVPGLRVALATTHLPLARVPAAITAPRLRAVLGVLLADLERRLHLSRPRVEVCGLNPHAGEGGHLGNEELRVIGPVLDELRAAGHDLVGPVPADTAFTEERLHATDAVLCMYHDQGLPVLKARGFGRAVNITLGLPFVRTSVDHGTALELAGTGRASATSLVAALETALEMQ